LDLSPKKLSQEFTDALRLLESDEPGIFITGRAGTGKSTLIDIFRRTTKKKVAFLAPTGVAALHIKGQTIHSFFGFSPFAVQRENVKLRSNRKIYQRLDAILIDEISMVRVDLLDTIDQFLRLNRKDPRPFGGCQMIFVGDLFQLPPVTSSSEEQRFLDDHYKSPYFFDAPAIDELGGLVVFELSTVYRQEEKYFLQILDSIRRARIDYDEIEEINRLTTGDFPREIPHIMLTSTNAKANRINQSRLAELPGEVSTYTAKITGRAPVTHYPVDKILLLKVGAQVMFVKNDQKKRYVNGTLGIVKRLEKERIWVEVEGEANNEIEVVPDTWEVVKYKYDENKTKKIDAEVVSSCVQMPLKLAWAITIHKSQGKTFERAAIDLGQRAFAFGQTYVALSRCRTIGGIKLSRPLKMDDIFVDERIVDFYNAIL
jgi:ATP-dependent exoDNAse (exonuclease V) alpha subunit